jgi:hypothetical protein
MSLDTFAVLANQYNKESDALADYEAVRELYTDLGINPIPLGFVESDRG